MDSSGLYRRLINTHDIKDTNSFNLFKTAKNDRSLIQRLCLQKKLPVHNGCVNSICWNQSGHYILSGSDDQHLCVTQAYTYERLFGPDTELTYLVPNFCQILGTNMYVDRHLQFVTDIINPYLVHNNDQFIISVVSCSGDGMSIFTDLERPDTSLNNIFSCHFGTAYEVTTVPNDPHTFLTCGEDGTVRWFDLRVKSNCSKANCSDDILVDCSYAVTALAVNHSLPYYLSVGCADSSVRTYDRRMLTTRTLGDNTNDYSESMVCLFKVPDFENKNHRITSLCYSPDAQEMLVSYSSDYIYLFDANERGGKGSSRQLNSFNGNKQKLSPTASSSSNRPLMKRLRVRGDWSDTGPNARPESERSNDVPTRPTQPMQSNLMQRMSDVLTRIFNSPQRTDDNTDNNQRNQTTGTESEQNNNESNINTDVNVSETRLEGEPSNSLSTVGSSQSSGSQPNCFRNKLKNLNKKLADNQNTESEETVVNLQYSGQGVNNGMITIETGVTSDSIDSNLDEDLNSNDNNIIDDINDRQTDEDINENNDTNIGFENETNILSNDMNVDEEEDNNESTDADTSGSGDQLLQSFDDVLKHLKEERDYERAQLPNVSMPSIKQRYTGHRNARTMIKEATFWGDDYVMSGSDCGHIFVWSRYTAELIMILEGDHHVVNCLQPHPFDPILASSGIDFDIKLWAPLSEQPFFDRIKAEEITNRNEVMLEETKDTITVPASFMIRMLTSLNHFRSNRASSRWRRIGAAARAVAEHSD